MGAGIAHVLLAAGYPTVLVETDEEAKARAVTRVRTSLERAHERGKLEQAPDEVLTQLTASTDRQELSGVGLVIESVPEIPELKLSVLSDVERVIRPDAVLATNTSSLSLSELGAHLSRPERFLGMHFFNPVPVQTLVEVIRTGETERSALDLAHGLAKLLGKETIEISNSPGFATSRLGVLLGLEAIRMVEEGVATPADIDKGMELGYRYPMGPCRLGDLVGHDVRLGIAEYLSAQLGPRFEPPALLREMVAAGKLGKKTGQGFYRWD